jgi:hypothetical protein
VSAPVRSIIIVAKPNSPLLGFNTNVKHKGKVFHIQTEDSGIKHPHVITHLFADGGRILKSLKTTYADHVGEETLTETIRTLMKEQHKAMFIALRDGEYDSLIDERFHTTAEGASAVRAPAAASTAVTVQAPVVQTPAIQTPAGASSATATSTPAAGRQALEDSAARAAPSSGAEAIPVTLPEGAAASGPDSQEAAAASAAQAWKPGIDVDMEVLNRAAAESESAPVYRATDDMPPPPPGLLSPKRPAGGYAMTSATTANQDPNVRYAASRPAAVFANSRPAEGGTVFGEDLISDKSLDEVILSFLSEEFGAKPDDDSHSGDGSPR